MKKHYIILGFIISFGISMILFNNEDKTEYINYDGFKLALSVDGENTDTLPSGNYFLVSYECNNDTILSWDHSTSSLIYNNENANDECSLKFESSPKLYNLVNIGDYISYAGDSTNGCSGSQCSGWNANQADTALYENYGYCYSSTRFYVYGWRVLYKIGDSVYIVSAGAPECLISSSSDSETAINKLNPIALKYCNSSYLHNGECSYETAHPFNGTDFYNFTEQYYGKDNARYLYNYNDGKKFGEPYCYRKNGNTYCGYNNDIIDNGGYYWFGSKYDGSFMITWHPIGKYIGNSQAPYSYGVRPVLKLDASILATGGKGTMEEPYTISERS